MTVSMMKKRILIINTGGTISSIPTSRGYEPAAGYVIRALNDISALSHPDMPHYEVKEYQPLLDSSNMTVEDWNKIAQDIASLYQQFDGFVIFHGTDTMAYTASALSFMLEHLGKPVILTGSQIPLSQVRNDAVDNIVTSLWLCAHYPIKEVCIYFNQRLMRGNRSRKVSSDTFGAFDSPNFPYLANIGINIDVQQHLLLKNEKKAFHFQAITPCLMANFRLFPGFSTEVLRQLLEQTALRGLVLETYGAGNAPNKDTYFLDLLSNACKRGVVIVNCTQCFLGGVHIDNYATGSSLRQAGVISGYDMTPEAVYCKLLYLFSKYKDVQDVKRLMASSLCGELLSQ